MAAVTICSDFGAQKVKSATVSTVTPSIYHDVMGPDAVILVFWMLNFKPTFSLSSFTFIKRLFSSSTCWFRQEGMWSFQPKLCERSMFGNIGEVWFFFVIVVLIVVVAFSLFLPFFLSLSLSGHPLSSNSLFWTLQFPKYWPGTNTSMRKRSSYAEGQWEKNIREELQPVD